MLPVMVVGVVDAFERVLVGESIEEELVELGRTRAGSRGTFSLAPDGKFELAELPAKWDQL